TPPLPLQRSCRDQRGGDFCDSGCDGRKISCGSAETISGSFRADSVTGIDQSRRIAAARINCKSGAGQREEMPMPHAVTKDNVRLHFEEAGTGTPIIFLHEFAADHTNWEPQMRYFSRGHRCIAYSARGYTPSDV